MKVDVGCSEHHEILCKERLHLPCLPHVTGDSCLEEWFSEWDSSALSPHQQHHLPQGVSQHSEPSRWLQGTLKFESRWPDAFYWERLWDSICDQWERGQDPLETWAEGAGGGRWPVCPADFHKLYAFLLWHLLPCPGLTFSRLIFK